MRDLLYLSETKMKDLVPQLPRKALKRLGMEGGLNVGVLSLRATLSPSEQTSQVALLDSVIRMIESERLTRRRCDPDLAAGDWVQFEETFFYGKNPPDTRHPLPRGELIYFNAADNLRSTFSLCGSPSHLKSAHYELPQEDTKTSDAKISAILEMTGKDYTDATIAPEEEAQDGRRTQGIALAGYARVLAVFEDLILGTPLYVEYASSGH